MSKIRTTREMVTGNFTINRLIGGKCLEIHEKEELNFQKQDTLDFDSGTV